MTDPVSELLVIADRVLARAARATPEKLNQKRSRPDCNPSPETSSRAMNGKDDDVSLRLAG